MGQKKKNQKKKTKNKQTDKFLIFQKSVICLVSKVGLRVVLFPSLCYCSVLVFLVSVVLFGGAEN